MRRIHDGVLALKTRPPRLRPGLVARERLVQLLLDGRDGPAALVVAPAGYGKTTLVSQWAQHDPRPFAWVTLDLGDNDPRAFLSAIAAALDAVEPLGTEVFEALDSPRSDGPVVALERLVDAVIGRERPAVLVLDGFHVLATREARQVVTAIWQAFGVGLQLALVSRSDAGLPVGRLRAHGVSVELRGEDLAMTTAEASMLLERAGLELAPEQVRRLARRTEGWPAGLRLAALVVGRRGRGDPDDVQALAGDDRIVAEYIREEFLAPLPRADVDFLTRTSVLERLSAPLCDTLLARDDSASVLQRLARSNVLLTPADRSGTAYRYHQLFAEELRVELRRREPGCEVELHRAAGAWCAAHGDTAAAISHAIAGHDVELAGRLVWGDALQHAARGDEDVVWAWLEGFTQTELVAAPLLALAAAGTALATGDLFEAAHWTAVADDVTADTQVVRAGAALMRAGIGPGDLAEVATSAARAHALLDETSPWRPLCRLLEGVALHLRGDAKTARDRLEEGAHCAAARAPLVQALCLAQLVLLVAEQDERDRATALAQRATAQIMRCGLEACPMAALVFAVSAERHVECGRTVEAARDVRRALGLLRRITDPSPWYDAECRIVLARTNARLNERAAAAERLEEAGSTLARAPDARVLHAWRRAALAEMKTASSSTASADWSLTAAELRVLRLLPTHHSFREIADRLYVSPNTVKTHARGIYRKLGVSSRGGAVDQARAAGIVDDAASVGRITSSG